MMKLINDDCLNAMDELIEAGVQVDAIITDPPYGNMKNAPSNWDSYKTYWDNEIEPKELYKRFYKLVKPNGRIILFSQEPYSSRLITNTDFNIKFNSRLIWLKDKPGNILGCNKNVLNYTEDILLFSNNKVIDNSKTKYKKIMNKYIKKYGVSYIEDSLFSLGIYKNYLSVKTTIRHYFGYTNQKTSRLINEDIYNHLSKYIDFEESYEELKKMFIKYSTINTLTFNLWENNKIKSNVFSYKKQNDTIHPTEKPIKLMEDLIKTYTNEDETVLDFTMGSGTTGVACKNLDRNFIGIELDEEYFDIAKERIK